MLILKIKLTDLDREHFFSGKTGTYCDLIVFPNEKPDQYGNTHVVYQGVSKEARQAGKKGRIVGNGTQKGAAAAKQAPSPTPEPATPATGLSPKDLPF